MSNRLQYKNFGGDGRHAGKRGWGIEDSRPRAPKPVYYRSTPFSTQDELDEYLSIQPFVCLECGKEVPNLSAHIHKAHGITVADYKVKWGIPQKYKFITDEYRLARSDMLKHRLDSGEITPRRRVKGSVDKNSCRAKRPRTAIQKAVDLENSKSFSRYTKSIRAFSDDDCSALRLAWESGRSYSSLAKETGVNVNTVIKAINGGYK